MDASKLDVTRGKLLETVGDLVRDEYKSHGLTMQVTNLLYLAATLNGTPPPSPGSETTIARK